MHLPKKPKKLRFEKAVYFLDLPYSLLIAEPALLFFNTPSRRVSSIGEVSSNREGPSLRESTVIPFCFKIQSGEGILRLNNFRINKFYLETTKRPPVLQKFTQ